MISPATPGEFRQHAMHCPCGRSPILARGLCRICYALRRQDERYFGGLREHVLRRDGYTCQGCGVSGRRSRSIAVHHRIPGCSRMSVMISLCPGCHAKIHHTRVVLSRMTPALLHLWRELHPHGHEQVWLNFDLTKRPEEQAVFRVQPITLFA